jgi:hypothetical protein
MTVFGEFLPIARGCVDDNSQEGIVSANDLEAIDLGE